jgi:3-dehydroquinate synthetase
VNKREMTEIKPITKEALREVIGENDLVVIDQHVLPLIPKLKATKVFIIKNPEEDKNLKTFEEMTSFFLNAGVGRHHHLYSIGGGAVSDLAGFVASSLLRGISWSIIPTTLLSQVDAAYGGKVGINTIHGKNLLGSFHEPQRIFLNSTFLESLPKSQMDSGMGEILKYGFLNKEVHSLLNAKEINLTQIIQSCLAHKKSIVDQDPKELGIRKTLNLGHTLGHAYEKEMNIPHGIAVILGMKKIFHLFNKKIELDKLQDWIKKFDINLPEEKINKISFLNYLSKDKKRSDQMISIILPENGIAKIVELPISEIEEKLNL